MKTASQRSWVSPITAVSFLAVGISGLMMLFHVGRFVRPMHEIVGVLFCIVGVIHLIINWRALLNYLRSKRVMALTAVVVVLCSLLLLTGSDEHGGGPRGPHGSGHGQMEED